MPAMTLVINGRRIIHSVRRRDGFIIFTTLIQPFRIIIVSSSSRSLKALLIDEPYLERVSKGFVATSARRFLGDETHSHHV